MSLEFLPPTEIETQRSAWFAQHPKPGMTLDEYLRLHEEALRQFPRTKEERQRKTESLMALPEFAF